MPYKNITLLFIFSFVVITVTKNVTLMRNDERDFYVIDNSEINEASGQKVQIKLFYECLCPDCIRFDTGPFKQAILKLDKYLDISTYPYGNAKTIKGKDGRIEFKCQHGPAECYGNKLHGCALDIITIHVNKTQALLFNSCMMENTTDSRGSDDNAANRCAKRMQLDPEPIINCANGVRGTQLLYQYGEESKKVNYNYVPYILVNGKVSDENSFIKDICSALASPPPECLQSLILD